MAIEAWKSSFRICFQCCYSPGCLSGRPQNDFGAIGFHFNLQMI